MSITCCEGVCVNVFIQHAVRVRHIVIVANPALQYFSTLSHKQQILK